MAAFVGSSDNEEQANVLANKIAQEVEDLRDEANELALLAEEFVDACKEFTANVPPVIYVQPGYTEGVFHTMEAPDIPEAPTLPEITIDPPNTSEPDFPEFVPSPVQESPSTEDLQFPTEPGAIVPGDLPAMPAVVEVEIPTAPSAEYSMQPLPTVTALPAAPTIGTAPTIVQPKALSDAGIDAPDFTSEIARLEKLAGTPVRVKEYQAVVPSVFGAIGGLLTGATSPAHQDYIDLSAALGREAGSFASNSMTRRGLNGDTIGTTMQLANDLARLNAVKSAMAADELFRDDARKLRFTLSVAAHSQAMNLAKLLTDLEFSTLVDYAEAQLARVAAVSAAYEGAVAALDGAAAQKTFEYTVEEGNEANYRLYIETIKAAGQQNRLSHKVFAITEGAKKTQVSTARTKVTAEDAKLQAFEAENQAVQAAAEGLDAKLVEYRGRVAAWSGRLAAAGAEWARYSARTDAISATNRAEAARLESQTLENRIIVTQAQAAAADLTADLADFRLGVATRQAELTNTQILNRLASDKARLSAEEYKRFIAGENLDATLKRPMLDGLAAGYKGSARFFAAATEASGRAAEMTQSANEQLAKAYAVAQEAAGRAVAAIESGRYSQMRASVSLSASGDLGASGGAGTTRSNSLSWGVREGWTSSKSFNVEG